MKRCIPLPLFLVLALAGPAPPANAQTPASATADTLGGWPDTPAGVRGRGWVTAFNRGEAAMKDFLATAMSTTSLAKRGVPQRVEKYRDLKERFGKLTLGEVVESKPNQVSVKLTDADGGSHEFTFEVEPKAPFHLATVSAKEPSHMHGLPDWFHH